MGPVCDTHPFTEPSDDWARRRPVRGRTEHATDGPAGAEDAEDDAWDEILCEADALAEPETDDALCEIEADTLAASDADDTLCEADALTETDADDGALEEAEETLAESDDGMEDEAEALDAISVELTDAGGGVGDVRARSCPNKTYEISLQGSSRN